MAVSGFNRSGSQKDVGSGSAAEVFCKGACRGVGCWRGQDHVNTPDPDLIKSKFSSGVCRSSIAAPMGGTTTMKWL